MFYSKFQQRYGRRKGWEEKRGFIFLLLNFSVLVSRMSNRNPSTSFCESYLIKIPLKELVVPFQLSLFRTNKVFDDSGNAQTSFSVDADVDPKRTYSKTFQRPFANYTRKQYSFSNCGRKICLNQTRCCNFCVLFGKSQALKRRLWALDPHPTLCS